MKKLIADPYPDNSCFFCGRDNENGLKLKFYCDEKQKEVSTEYRPSQYFVGQGKILHGGIQMGLLDEIMGWTCYVFTKEMAVTSGLEVRFLMPVYVSGEKIRVTCRVLSRKGAKVKMLAELLNSEKAACTTATGTYHVLKKEKYDSIISGKSL